MRIFLDTNVLVSAFATRGLCADLFRQVTLEHELVVGEFVLTELGRVLRERIRLPAETVKSIDALLREHSVVPTPPTHLDLGLPDAADEWVVASAVAGRANVLVTGDGAVLAAANAALRTVNPRSLWEMLRATASK